MKIKKYVSLAVLMVALLVATLPISFAVNPSVVTADMPEPVADQYNRYIVVNDLLIWVSYQIDYVYQILNPTESIWYTKNLTAYETYSQESNGTYFDPTESMQGHLSQSGDVFNFVNVDIYNAPIVGGVQAGTYEPIVIGTDGSGTITYQDAELALTKVGQTQVSEGYNIQCIIVDNDSIRIRFRKNERFTTSFLANLNYYVNIIYIPTGECIKRYYNTLVDTAFTTQQITVNINNIEEEYEENGYIVSLQTYGIVCVNEANINFDRPLIIWNTNSNWDWYFMNTMLYVEEIWRNIVDVTSPVEPDTTARWGENLSDATPKNDLDVQPGGQEIALTQALNNINFSPQNQDKFEQWAGMFSNSKLIACCVFALACGSVILTLGKKKSE